MTVLEPLAITDEQRSELERLVRGATTEQRLVARARIVLAAGEGCSNREIAASLRVSPDTVGRWRRRFAQGGVEGLGDLPRPGRPPVYGHDERVRIVAKACEQPPDGASHWTLAALHEALHPRLGISISQLFKIMDGLDLKPWKTRSWLTSHDPDFWAKAADVCGLYLDPPDHAVVYSVDEKTGIQATSRVNPTRPARPGQVERREFEYRRHGTTSLFAALEVHTGAMIAQPTDRNRAQDFIGFLDHLDDVTPDGLRIHLVLDNGSSHVAKATRQWLADRADRFEVHHTPTHASWLNQVELFFSILTRRVIRRGEFDSVDDLIAKIQQFVASYNRTCKPFRWTYQGRPLQVA